MSNRASSKDYKQKLDAIRQLVCIGLAAWMLIRTNDLWQFSGVLAAGYIDPHRAKEILVKTMKALVTESK